MSKIKNLTFPEALEAIISKKQSRIKRAVWNIGEYVEIAYDSPNDFFAYNSTLNKSYKMESRFLLLNPLGFEEWRPKSEDMLAKDWLFC
jgi:hypothetical protein